MTVDQHFRALDTIRRLRDSSDTLMRESAADVITELIIEIEQLRATTTPRHLLGEMSSTGVIWFNQNPHAHPIGTKFYADKEA